MKVAVKVNAGNDRNGNARRGWVVFNQHGMPEDFVSEESGNAEEDLRKAGHPGVHHLREAIPVSPSSIRDWKKAAKAHGKNR